MTRIAMIALEAPVSDHSPLVGGSAKVPFELFKVLREQSGLEVDFFYFVGGSHMSRTYKINCLPGKLYLKTLLRELALLCRAPTFFSYDVIQIHHPHFSLVLSCLKRVFRLRSKIIVKSHGTAIPELNANKYTGLKKVILKMNAFFHLNHDRASLRLCDLCLCSSQYQVEEMMGIYRLPESKIRVIYNGYDASYFPQGRQGKKPKSMIMCGRLVPKKNFEYAIALFKRLVREDREYTLSLVCGSRQKIEHRQTYANILKEVEGDERIRIYFDLDKNALATLMLESDIALIPSVGYESIPSVIYEFLAANCRVFATLDWGITEILGNDSCLNHLLEEDIQRIRRGGPTDCKVDIAWFSYNSIAKYYMELY